MTHLNYYIFCEKLNILNEIDCSIDELGTYVGVLLSKWIFAELKQTPGKLKYCQFEISIPFDISIKLLVAELKQKLNKQETLKSFCNSQKYSLNIKLPTIIHLKFFLTVTKNRIID
jgi:hypothetical protein